MTLCTTLAPFFSNRPPSDEDDPPYPDDADNDLVTTGTLLDDVLDISHNEADLIHVVKLISRKDQRAKQDDFVKAIKKDADGLKKRKM